MFRVIRFNVDFITLGEAWDTKGNICAKISIKCNFSFQLHANVITMASPRSRHIFYCDMIQPTLIVRRFPTTEILLMAATKTKTAVQLTFERWQI